ncbi:MAG: hypothetical protein Q8Q31_02185 [Nanoarchaeota archaeon]|nr:hypothetical protein [Nanoarchaeota archaeon]
MKTGFSKRGAMLIAGFFLLVSLIGFSSAYGPSELSNTIQDGIEYFKAFYTPFLEIIIGDSAFSDLFFIKVLLLVLTFVVVKTVLARTPTFKDNKPVVFIVSLIVAILSIRYMTDIQVIQGVLMSYDTLGIAITTIIPFIVWFFFVEKSIQSSAARRILWLFFLGVFSVIWYHRYSHLGSFGNYLYGGIIILCLLAAVFDRRVRVYLALSEIRGMERSVTDKVVLDLLGDLEKAEKMSNTEYGKRRAKEIRQQLKDLGVRSMR